MKNKKSKLVIEYLAIVILLVGVFLIMALFLTNKYKQNLPVNNSNTTQDSNNNNTDISNNTESTEPSSKTTDENTRLNVMIFGIDKEEACADVMVLASFDTETYEISMISLPRDTRVKMLDDIYDEVSKRYTTLPEDKYVKLNSLYAYGSTSKGIEYSIRQIEDLLNIKVDNYVKMNLAGFRNIVNAIGGVEFEVPMDMKYDDPVQDLYIDLKQGMQTLDGKQAEQLIRYRKGNEEGTGYAQGDIDRIAVQQSFMKAFAKKLLNMDNLVKSSAKLAVNIIRYVTTDINIEDVLSYMQYIDKIDINNVDMMTLPGEGENIDGISFYLPDEIEAEKLIDEYFK